MLFIHQMNSLGKNVLTQTENRRHRDNRVIAAQLL